MGGSWWSQESEKREGWSNFHLDEGRELCMICSSSVLKQEIRKKEQIRSKKEIKKTQTKGATELFKRRTILIP